LTARYAYPLLLISGALLSLAFPEPDIAPLAWVAIVPLLMIARGETAGRGFLAGLTFGLGFFGLLLYWISLIGWMGWAALVLLESLCMGLFGLAWALASRRTSAPERVLYAAALWVVVEFLRSTLPAVGFTWGQLAQSQTDLGWMLRPAALGGGWLVAFILVAVNACLAELIARDPRKNHATAAIAASVAVALLVCPLLLPAGDATGEKISVAIVQGNVPQDIPVGDSRDLAILDSHRVLTEELEGREVDFVVWAESSLALGVDTDLDTQVALESAAQTANAPIIAGGNLDDGPENYKVMAFHISPQGRVVDRYQKTHLVPFGEYVPVRALFGWIPTLEQVGRDAVPGDEIAVFDVAGGPVAPVISFEGDFGSLVRRRMDEGGRLLTVLTNTSTWGHTWASAQHVAFSQVRAAENGVWVVHAAISGISAFIQPDGKVVERIPLWTADSATHEVSFAEDTTFYARVGEWMPLLCALISAWGLGTAWRRRREA
jgi:apolipoprotein N-acyltransferase